MRDDGYGRYTDERADAQAEALDAVIADAQAGDREAAAYLTARYRRRG